MTLARTSNHEPCQSRPRCSGPRLAVPIVIFYILKIRLRRVPVSTVIFWRQIFDEKQPRSHLAAAAAPALAAGADSLFLLLLVFALAEPFFDWEVLQARRLVLVVDNSASMNATDVGPDAGWPQAKEHGQRIIDGLRFRDEMADRRRRHAAAGRLRPDRPPATLHDALDGIAADRRPDPRGPRPSRWPAGSSPSRATARTAEVIVAHRRLLREGAGASSRRRTTCSSSPSASARGNVGITRFQVRRSLLDPIGYEILVRGRQRLRRAGRVPARDRPRTATAGRRRAAEAGSRTSTWSQVIEKTSAEGGRLDGAKAADHADALAADNKAVALLPRRERSR